MLTALVEAGVDAEVVRYLKDLYKNQQAYVCLDSSSRSRLIAILRGVRQGDPMSPILFNNVTRKIFEELKAKWAHKGLGTVVCCSATDKSTHAMFTDDTTLLASSRRAIISMIRDVRNSLAEHGLNLNMDKCLIQTSCMDVQLQPLDVDGQMIPMVSATAGFKILGTQWTLQGRTSAELRSRIAAAWRKFHSLWPMLGKRDGGLAKKLRVFDSSVTQTALWCNESWLLTVNEKRLLESAQNCMLGKIAGPRRRPQEEWLDWVTRSTRAARKAAESAGIRMWLQAHLKAKWGWAGHVLRMDPDRLASRALQWRDSEWWAIEMEVSATLRLHRPHRTRWFRWEDDLRRYAAEHMSGSWQSEAQKRNSKGCAQDWKDHCNSFIKFVKKK